LYVHFILKKIFKSFIDKLLKNNIWDTSKNLSTLDKKIYILTGWCFHKKTFGFKKEWKKKKLATRMVNTILEENKLTRKFKYKKFKKKYNILWKCERIYHYPNSYKIVKISIKYPNKIWKIIT